MKKSLRLIIILIIILPCSSVHASWTIISEPFGNDTGIRYGSIQWGDYDNDGDLDLAVSGARNQSTADTLVIYRNDAGVFTDVSTPLGAGKGLREGSIQWGDYDNDGDLDLAVSGRDISSSQYRLVIYRNDGGDVFTNAAEPEGVNQGYYLCSIQWGDYDKDGDLDLLVAGHDGVARRSAIFKNDGAGGFDKISNPIQAASQSSVQWGDYDNDGDLDIALSGDDGGAMRLIVYRNDGNDNFTNVAEPMATDFNGVYYSSIQWGDYDNDGNLDLLVSGTDNSMAQARLIVFRNNGNNTFTNVSEPYGPSNGITQSSVQWGDYDSDGDLDILAAGSSNFTLFRYDGSDTYARIQDFLGNDTGLLAASVQWGDYDNDGDLDIAASGMDDTGNYRFMIIRNDGDTVNTPPDIPVIVSPKGDTVNAADSIFLRWNSITTDTTPELSITYNIRIGTSPGDVGIMSSDTDSNDTVGFVLLGNVQNGTSAYMDLSPGTYYWSVQAVDGGMMRSAWAGEETFIAQVPSYNGPLWYVSADTGFDDALRGNGSSAYPFYTITKALSEVSSGETIIVYSGSYSETVEIPADNVAVLGSGTTTVIDFNDSSATTMSRGVYANGRTGLIIRNLSVKNCYRGIEWASVSNSNIENVFVHSNGQYGLLLDNSSNNTILQCGIETNDSYQVGLTGTSSSNTFTKNNIIPSSVNPDSGLINQTGNSFDLSYQWWGVTNEDSITGRISGAGAGLITWQPFRFGEADIISGADVIAPDSPTGLQGDTSNTGVINLVWDKVTLNQDGTGITDLLGYRVYRSTDPYEKDWKQNGFRGSTGDTKYSDGGLVDGETYYYRITAYDNNISLENESWFSDSLAVVAAGAQPPYSGPVWYVSIDTGLDGNNGSGTFPFRTVSKAMQMASSGETVYLFPGIYTDTVSIDTDYLTLTGQDSSVSVIDFGDSSSDTAAIGIYASNRTGLVIQNIKISNNYIGIQWDNVDSSIIQDVTVMLSGDRGVSLLNCDTNTVRDNYFYNNTDHGLYLEASDSNLILSNMSSYNGALKAGFCLYLSSDYNTLDRNTASNNYRGFYIESSNYDTFTDNLSINNSNYGIYLKTADNHVFIGDTTQGNGNMSFWIDGNSDSNTVQNCLFTGNNNDGLVVSGRYNTVTRCVSFQNTRNGFELGLSNTFTDNIASFNQWSGFDLNNDDNNYFYNNVSSNNSLYGFRLKTGSQNNVFIHSTADSNALEQFYIDNSTSNTFTKSNILPSLHNPTKGVYNNTSGSFDFTKSWWGTTDSTAIAGLVNNTSGGTIVYYPFRLGFADTSINADTVAPSTPDTVSALGTSTSTIVVTWDDVTTSEEPEAAVNLTGYRVYRSATADTSLWELRAELGIVLSFTDSGLTPDRTMYYKVTAFDNNVPYENESFYSDSTAAGKTRRLTQVNVDQTVPPANTIIPPDTFSVISFTIIGETTVQDTLTFFRAGFYGAVTDIETASLYADADSNGLFSAGDNFISNLYPTGAGIYEDTSISYYLDTDETAFIVVVTIYDTSQIADTLQAYIPAYGVKTVNTDTGPETIQVCQSEFSIGSESQVVVVVNGDSPASKGVDPGDSVAVIALALTGDTSQQDTLAVFQLGFQGNNTNYETVALYEDANGNALFDVEDTLVAELSVVSGNIYGSFSLNYSLDTSVREFIGVVWTYDTSTVGDTIRAYIPAYGIKTVNADSAPGIDTFSPATLTIVMDTSGPNAWYVNDNSTAGDSFTTAAGSDVNAGFAAHVPKLTVNAVLPLLTPGDTVYIDVGTFTESVYVTTDSVIIIGADSFSTIIDPPEDSTSGAGTSGILVKNANSVTIKYLAVRDAYIGIEFQSADYCSIESCSMYMNGRGFSFDSASNNDTVSGCAVELSGEEGGYFAGQDVSIVNSIFEDNNKFVRLLGAGGYFYNNRVTGARSGTVGYGLNVVANSIVVDSNILMNNNLAGLMLGGGNNSIIRNNIITNNSTSFGGIYITASGTGNVIEDNTINNNNYGLYFNGGDNVLVRNNNLSGNTFSGAYIWTNSNANIFINNRFFGNKGIGILINAAHNNAFYQNDIDSSGNNVVKIQGASSADTFQRNNINVPGLNPVYGFYVTVIPDKDFDVTRNYWYTTNPDSINAVLSGPDVTYFSPYRLGVVDTGTGADSIAPESVTVTVDTGTDGQVRIVWTVAAVNEDGFGGDTALGGYRVYRSTDPTIKDWGQQLFATTATGDTDFIDSAVQFGETYYYRVTSFDTYSIVNESFYSDSVSVVIGNADTDDISGTVVFANFRNDGDSGIFVVLKNIDGDTLDTTYTTSSGFYQFSGFYNSDTWNITFYFSGYVSRTVSVKGLSDTDIGLSSINGGDIDGDDDADTVDFDLLRANINQPAAVLPAADLDNNGWINTTDLSTLIQTLSNE